MSRNRLIDDYLRRLERALALDHASKVRILEEIRDHLLTAVQEEVSQGYPRAEAERRALARFGQPEIIAAQFALAEAPRPASSPPQRRTHRCRDLNLDSRRSLVSENSRSGKVVLDHCSFCGKSRQMVKDFIVSPNAVAICNECLQLCKDIISRERSQTSSSVTPIDRGRRDCESAAAFCCTFCGRDHAKVERLIAGPRFVFICNRCVEQFTETVLGGIPAG